MPARTPLERLRRKLTIETLWLYVLASLAKHGPTYAYNIKRIIRDQYGFNPSTVTLYTVIYRLEREGYLEKTDGEYRITPQGLDILRQGIQFLEETVSSLHRSLAGGSNGP